MIDSLFPIEEVPEVPLIREPRRRAEAAFGALRDERFQNDYPPDWDRCQACDGEGRTYPGVGGLTLSDSAPSSVICSACLGMGSWKAMARLLAGHRCERCLHPYLPKDDAVFLGRLMEAELYAAGAVDAEFVPPKPSWVEGGWSACDERCDHEGPMRLVDGDRVLAETQDGVPEWQAHIFASAGSWRRETQWRILTVHHLDGDKANCRWWNLASLCQRCHLYIQGKVVMERVYPHEHSEWFKPHAAGYYAWVYLGQEVTREEAVERMDELLALELAPAYEGAR